MRKYIVVLLYILAVLTLAGGLTVLVFHFYRKSAADTTTDAAVQMQGDISQTEEADRAAQNETEASGVTQNETETSNLTEAQTAEEESDTADRESGTETESAKEDSVTLVFAGDVMLEGVPCANYDADGITGIVSQELLEELTGADILMVNNEFAWSSRGTAMENKEYTYRVNPSYIGILKELGVDVVSLANNHTLDFGKEALSDTFVTLDEAGILYAGAGETIERAEQIQVVEQGGKKFGFIAGSRVIPVTDWNVENAQPGIFTVYDYSRLVELVAQAKETCDFVTVYLHWGVERVEYPEDYEREMAQACVAAGADLIIGGHAHCIQGVEWIEDVPVFYALGDFIFLRETACSAVVEVTVDAQGAATYRYLPTTTSGGVTKLMEGNDAQETYRYVESISWGTTIDENGVLLP